MYSVGKSLLNCSINCLFHHTHFTNGLAFIISLLSIKKALASNSLKKFICSNHDFTF
ncbi:MAG: hypothetical protein Q8S84_08990 [bacterium]|nr:hypothetical protein [bacterium]